MDPLLKDTLTIGFSSASLLISIVSLTMAIFNYRRTGSLVRLSLDYERHAGIGSFVLHVKNEGYHSIKIVKLRMKAGEQTIAVEIEPFSLEYGDEKPIRIPLAAYSQTHPLEITSFELMDIASKVYPISTRHLQHKIRK